MRSDRTRDRTIANMRVVPEVTRVTPTGFATRGLRTGRPGRFGHGDLPQLSCGRAGRRTVLRRVRAGPAAAGGRASDRHGPVRGPGRATRRCPRPRDPEQVKNLIDGCFERLVADIDAFGGRVDKIIGDAIVALFGAPTAHEDDAERAVRAALRMQETLAAHTAELDVDIRMRVGVNTGEVLVGALRAGGDYTAMGDVVNTANRLQSRRPARRGARRPGHLRGHPPHRPLRRRWSRSTPRAARSWSRRGGPTAPSRRPGTGPSATGPGSIGREPELGPPVPQRRERHLQRAGVAAAPARRGRRGQVAAGRGAGEPRRGASTTPSSSRAAACPTARPTSGGRSPTPSATAPASARATPPTRPSSWRAPRCASRSARTPAPPRSTASTRASSTSWATSPSCAAIDPARAREEATSAVVTYAERFSRAPPGRGRAVRPALGRRPRARAGRHAARPARRAGGSWCWPPPARSVEERWHPPHGRHNLVVAHPRPAHVGRRPRRCSCELAGADLGAGLAKELLDRSGGNPFFLEELVTLLSDAGMVGDRRRHRRPRGPRRLPDTLRGPRRGPPRRPHPRRAARPRRLRGARAPRPDDGHRGDGREAPRHRRRAAGPRVARGQGAPRAQRQRARARSGPSAPTSCARSPTARSPRPTGPARTPASPSGWRRTRTPTATPSSTASPTTTSAPPSSSTSSAASTACPTTSPSAPCTGSSGRPPAPTRPRSRSWPSASTARASACSPGSTARGTAPSSPVGLAPWPGCASIAPARADALAAVEESRQAGADGAARPRPRAARARRRRAEGVELGGVGGGPRRGRPRVRRRSATRRGEAEVLRLRGFGALVPPRVRRRHRAARAGAGRASRRSTTGAAWPGSARTWRGAPSTPGRAEEAEVLLRKAAATFEEIGDQGGLRWARGLLAWTRFQQGHSAEAGEMADADPRRRPPRRRPLGHRHDARPGRLRAALDRPHPQRHRAPPRGPGALRRASTTTSATRRPSAVLGRALVLAGQVEEGLEMVASMGRRRRHAAHRARVHRVGRWRA